MKRLSLMATLVAVAAVGVMGIGAGSASAYTTILCHTYHPTDYKCPVADRYQVGEEIRGRSLEVKLTDSVGFVTFSCKEATLDQVVQRNNLYATPLTKTTAMTFNLCSSPCPECPAPKPVAPSLGEPGYLWQMGTLDATFGPVGGVKTYSWQTMYECQYGINSGRTDAFNQSLVFKKVEVASSTPGCPSGYFTGTYHLEKPLWVTYN